jgi:hypothetical protein
VRDETKAMARGATGRARSSPQALLDAIFLRRGRVARKSAHREACPSSITPSPVALAEVLMGVPSPLAPPPGPWRDPAATSVKRRGLPRGATILRARGREIAHCGPSASATILQCSAPGRASSPTEANQRGAILSVPNEGIDQMMREVSNATERTHRSQGRPAITTVLSQPTPIPPTQAQRRIEGGAAGPERRHLRAVLLVPVVLLLALVANATPALASPEWGITMTHANAYGLQAGECPGGKEMDVPGEPEKDCGVDPYTGSGTTFAQESGFNTYTINVKNTAAPTTGPAAGDMLSCETGTWYEGPTFTYDWLRNGVAIVGAESAQYTLTDADEGNAVQCQVTATNASGVAVFTTNAIAVSPSHGTALPAEEGTRVHVPGEGSEDHPIGETLSCEPGTWANDPTFSYQWLRNGTAIAGAESDTYALAAADAGTAVQCQVTATNAGGSVVVDNEYPTYVGPTLPTPNPPYPDEGFGPTIPISTSPNETSGPMTVADQLPEGLVFAGTKRNPAVSGTGWDGGAGEGSCTLENGATGVTCTNQTPLAPGASYSPITLRVRATGDAPLGSPPSGGVTNTAAVSGGGATASVLAHDPTTIAPAVPFGIQSFTTSVTEALGNPFTQAGGHPLAATASLVFNYSVEHEGTLWTAGGTPKDVQTELPPGFIGDALNAPKCTLAQFQAGHVPDEFCPAASKVGFVTLSLSGQGDIKGGRAEVFPDRSLTTYVVYNLEPTPGTPAAFAFVDLRAVFALDAVVRSNGDYGITIGDSYGGRGPNLSHGLQALSLTFCSYGVTGYGNEPPREVTPATVACAAPTAGAEPLLTNPTQCTGAPPATTLHADTYQDPADDVSKTTYTGTHLVAGAPSATESFVTGCDELQFQPEVELKPSPPSEGGTTQADEPTGASFALKVPETNEAGTNATPELKDATVTLPEGMTLDPSAADGLQACSNAQFGLASTAEPAEPAVCPLASQIGTVKVVTPLLEKPLEGRVFLGEPECGVSGGCTNADAESGHIFRLFVQIRSYERGVIVKLAGHVSANPTTGRLQATFAEQPQLPFSELLLNFTGGARAPLANPQSCGTFTTSTDLTPWSAPGLGGLTGSEPIAGSPDATPSSSFGIDWNGTGGACPAIMPFSPSFTAGSQTPAAGAPSAFSVTFGRDDREQDLSGVTVTTPPGLLGDVAQVPRCPEAEANVGTCGPESLIGSTTVGAGPGPHPFYLGGRVYLTGPYKGQPFGLSVVVPAVAGPFNLGTVVVRAAIAVNPSTAALTIASDPLPQYVDGVQLRLRRINVEVNRPGFMLNPTSCVQQTVGATITAAQGATSTASSPYEVGGCSSIPFDPKLTASAGGQGSKADGASLNVRLESAGLGQANIAKVDLQLPKALPSRDSTLRQACTAEQFEANPAGCPEGSVIGRATIHTPILNNPLIGPGYLVSHGGAAFPDVEFVLQGERVLLVLDGKTDIKKGITYSNFEAAPDAPFTSFEAELSAGPHSIFTANVPTKDNYSLCGATLTMPTKITGQNGAVLVQTTKIALTGCRTVKAKPLTRAQQRARALRACQKKGKQKRALCEQHARRKYAPITKVQKTNPRGKQ